MILVGCCGKAGYSLKAYSKLFDILETQEAFYRIVGEKTLVRWREEAAGKLAFSIKAFQGLTHPGSSPTWRRAGSLPEWFDKSRAGLLADTPEVRASWLISVKAAKLLNAIFIVVQLPPSFKPTDDNIRRIREFFGKFKDRGGIGIGIEVRGTSWSEYSDVLRDSLREAEATHIVDPLFQDPVYVHELAYFRLHGRLPSYRYQYTTNELRILAEKVKRYRDSLVLFNNLAMAEDAIRFKNLVRGSKEQIAPPSLEDRLNKIFRGGTKIPLSQLLNKYGYMRVSLDSGEEPTLSELLKESRLDEKNVSSVTKSDLVGILRGVAR